LGYSLDEKHEVGLSKIFAARLLAAVAPPRIGIEPTVTWGLNLPVPASCTN
jgi:hypothetical protein